MRISDVSSDVCSSDLRGPAQRDGKFELRAARRAHAGDARDPVPFQRSDAADPVRAGAADRPQRSEEHTSELQSLMRISYAVFCLKKTTTTKPAHMTIHHVSDNNLRKQSSEPT